MRGGTIGAIFFGVIAVLSIAIWQRLPIIVGKLVERAASQANPHVGLQRLKIGHAMAGGINDPEAANVAMADAMKAMLTAKIFGVKETAARGAFRSLIGTLGTAEQKYLAPAMGFGLGPADYASTEIAEGLRYMSHITRVALQLYLEPAPQFMQLVNPSLKLLGDNPDSLYYITRIDETKAYKISGCRAPSEVYFSAAVHAAAVPGEAFQRVATSLNDDDLSSGGGIDRKGCWSILLAPEALLSQWRGASQPAHTVLLPMPATGATVITRHYFETSPPAQLNAAARHAVEASLASTRAAGLTPRADSPHALRSLLRLPHWRAPL